jgi:hypothetical protein
MDILPVIAIFIGGFLVGSLLTGSGSAVRIAQSKAEVGEAFRAGWWAGLQDARSSQTKTPEPPSEASPKRKGMN